MRLRIKDDIYEVDHGRITVAEAKAFKRHAGMATGEFRPGLIKGDPDAMIFLMWLAKTRAGERVDWSSFDDYDLVSDVEILRELDSPGDEDDDKEQSGEGRADPTRTSGTTRKTGSTSTSRRSRSTSGSTRAKSTS